MSIRRMVSGLICLVAAFTLGLVIGYAPCNNHEVTPITITEAVPVIPPPPTVPKPTPLKRARWKPTVGVLTLYVADMTGRDHRWNVKGAVDAWNKDLAWQSVGIRLAYRTNKNCGPHELPCVRVQLSSHPGQNCKKGILAWTQYDTDSLGWEVTARVDLFPTCTNLNAAKFGNHAILHELGHVLTLDHSPDPADLMYWTVHYIHTEPDYPDLLALRSRYPL